MKLHAGLMIVGLLLAGWGGGSTLVAELKPNTLAAFDRYAGAREAQIGGEIRDAGKFFWVDRLPEGARQKAYADMRAGQIVIDQGRRTEVPDGLVHHWTGAGFIPGATLQQTLAFIQDYNHHADHYQPDVIGSKLLARNGNYFRINLRFRKKKILTVVLDTEHEVTYTQLDASRVASSAHTTRISEVENAGTPAEKLLPPGKDSGFLWKMNTYWRFAERDGGTYVQCETISLTRDVPFGLGWIVNRFVNSVPQEGLTFTLQRTRERVMAMKK